MPEEAGRKRPIVILRLRTDSGIEGIGVTLLRRQDDRQPAHAVDELAALTVGEDPLRVEAIVAKLRAGTGVPAGRAASSPWRCRRSTSRCGTSRARRSTSRCGSCSAAHRDRVPTYASRRAAARPHRSTRRQRGRADLLQTRASREMKTQLALPGEPTPAEEVEPHARGARGDRSRHQADVRHQPALAAGAGDRYRQPGRGCRVGCSGSRT